MTLPQSSTGKAGRAANNSLPEAGVPHAYVENGQLYIMMGGRYRPYDQSEAFWLWVSLSDSPYPSTQERVRQIRAAMDEAYPQELAA